MAPPTRVFSVPKSTGEQLSAAEVNALDDGQYNAIVRNGTTPLLATSTIDLGDGTEGDPNPALQPKHLVITGTGDTRCKLKAANTRFTGTAWPEVDSRSVTNYAPSAAPIFDPAIFNPTIAGGLIQVSNTLPILIFAVDLPIDTVITAVRVPVQKSGGSSGVPSVKPQVAFEYIDVSTGAHTVGSTTDTSSTEPEYEAFHTIALTGLNHTVTAGRRYAIRLTGDNASTGTGDGLNVYLPFVDITYTKLRF